MAKRFAQESNKRINKKRNKKNGLIILIVLIIILILGVINLAKNKWNMQRTVSDMISSVTGEEVEIINALILGISEDIDTELTDTIILVSYNPYTQKSYMVSIPRDTYIGKSDTSISMYDKINSVYSKYGVDKIIEHVEKLTGVEIEYYAVVRTGALIDIVDIIGGVNFEVPIDMKYDDEYASYGGLATYQRFLRSNTDFIGITGKIDENYTEEKIVTLEDGQYLELFHCVLEK